MSKKHCVYRSSALTTVARNSGRGSKCFEGISIYIDLRSSEEVEALGNYLPPKGLQMVSVPVDTHCRATEISASAYADWYVSTVFDAASSFARAFTLVAENACSGVIFACKQGKDRTGLLAAALQETAGVPRRIILRDYAESCRLLLQSADVYEDSWKKRNETRASYARRYELGDGPLRLLYERLGQSRTPLLDVFRANAESVEEFDEAIDRIEALVSSPRQ